MSKLRKIFDVVQSFSGGVAKLRRPISGFAGDVFRRVHHWFVTNHLGQLSVASFRDRLNRVQASFGWDRDGNVTCAGYNVARNTVWHVSSVAVK